MTNPYSTGSPAPGGRADPYGAPHPGQPATAGGPTRPPFVDPYQPRDHQPRYGPPLFEREVGMQNPSSVMSGGTPERPRTSVSVGTTTGAARIGAVACLLLTALLVSGHGALLAVGVCAVFYGVCSSPLPKLWAGNTFNLLLTYCLQVVVLGIILGLIDLATGGTLRESVGFWIRTAFSLLFVAAAICAAFGKYVRFPLRLRVFTS